MEALGTIVEILGPTMILVEAEKPLSVNEGLHVFTEIENTYLPPKYALSSLQILTGLKIAELIIRSIRRPRLDVRLTPDAFFRLNDHGETLFCNTVLLAWNGPILITGTRAVLEKTDSPVKSFPFKVLEFGEKVK